MQNFRYRAVADGAPVKGTTEALSQRAARNALAASGLEAIELKLKRKLTELDITPQKVTTPELMHFSRQLAAFLRAGIPILDALTSLAEGTDNDRLETVLYEMADALREGETFADAVEEHPKVFPSVYQAVIRTAELTGNLDGVLDQLSAYLERDLDTKRQITSALTYPSIVVLMAIGTVAVVAGWVLPKFETFFASFDAELPLPTRMLMFTTDFLLAWWWALLAALIVFVASGVAASRFPDGRRFLHAVTLRLPVFGETIRYAIVERFCRSLGAMVRSGVALADSLQVAAATTNNLVFTDGLTLVREKMIRGEGLAQPIAESELFPSAMTQMVKAGEDTGTLDEQLETAAGYFEQELRFKIKAVTAIFEPAIIVFVGALVGFVAIALVSAMYGLYRQTGGAA